MGDRETLKADSFIPLAMAVIYLVLFFYFKSIGGYRAVHIEGQPADTERQIPSTNHSQLPIPN